MGVRPRVSARIEVDREVVELGRAAGGAEVLHAHAAREVLRVGWLRGQRLVEPQDLHHMPGRPSPPVTAPSFD